MITRIRGPGWLGVVLALLSLGAWAAPVGEAPVLIGVLAKRGADRALEQWGPTAAYLGREVAGRAFRIVPLDFGRVIPAVRGAEVDFVLANSSFYVLLERHHGVSRIATLRNRLRRGDAATRFGGVFFRRAERTDIATLEDLDGRRLAAVEESSFGGYQAGLRELRTRGVRARETRFAGTHDGVVELVLAGGADAGTVRTDTLERMSAEGRLDLTRIRVIDDLKGREGFHLHRSTRLYPEWPLAALPHVGDELRRQVAAALLGMPADSPAARAGANAGWVVPLNYQPVHDLLQELRLPPYEDAGRIDPAQLLRQYAETLITGLAAVLLLSFYALRTRALNRALSRSEARAREQAVAAERQRFIVQRAYDRLNESETKFTRLADAALDGILVLGDDGRVVYCNRAAERILRRPRDAIVGEDFHRHFVPSGRQEQAHRGFAQFARTGTGPLVDRVLELEGVRGDGETFPVELAVSGMRVDGRWHALGVLRDISERKRAEERLRQEREKAERFLNIAGSLIVALDRDARVMLVNDRGCGILGLPREEVLGQDWFERFSPPTRRAADRALFARLLDPAAGGGHENVRGELMDRDGGRHTIAWSLVPLREPGQAQPVGVLASGLDVTQEVAAERALQYSRQSFDNVVQKNRSGILLVDGEGRIRFANPAAEYLLGTPRDGLLDTPFDAPDLDRVGELSVRRQDGSPGIAEMTASETEWEGRPARLVMLHDITERKEAEARIQHMAFHDDLTGLPNRTLFQDRLHQAIRRARRGSAGLAVLFMDLDRFKEVNDTLGHAVGDQLLRAVGERLRRCVRSSDTVARMGGDEFTVLLEDLHGPEQVLQVAEKVHACMGEPVTLAGRELFAVPSIGISLYPDHGEDVETLLKHADAAMYHAKRSQNGGASVYQLRMGQVSGERLELEQGLRKAVQEGQFALHYQAQVDLASGRPVGLEALLRWQHPEHGLLGADRFIDTLEDTALILPVGEWVVREACRQMRQWQEGDGPTLPVAVNISPRHLAAAGLERALMDALEEFAIDPGRLRLELTETAVVQDFQHALELLQRLRSLGLALHMDDFGTGYSSLSMVRELPFDVVKVDRGFVRDLDTNRDNQALARAAIAMAHSLGKGVIAEGVETEDQRRLLLEFGCDAAQGWLFARALPAAQVPDAVARLAAADPGQAPGRLPRVALT